MFPRPLSQCFYLKRRLFCQNQHIFIYCLPIDFFYFEDFRWPIFGKMIGQKRRMLLTRKIRLKAKKSYRQLNVAHILHQYLTGTQPHIL